MQLDIFPELKVQKLDLLLLINIPDNPDSDIIGFKQLTYNEIGYFNAYHSKPHISLGKFNSSKTLLQREIESFRCLLADSKKFPVSMKGFAFFDHGKTKTIYVSIENPEPSRNIFHSLFVKNPQIEPHITIAKSIPNHQFDKAWALFENRAYEKSFICDKVTVLKRSLESDEKWQKEAEIFLE